MARTTGSWLSGPSAAMPGKPVGYRGEALGLPASGRGSLSGSGRRVAALVIDWFISTGLASLVTGGITGATSTITLAIWFVIGVAAVALFGFTPGQFFLGIRVGRIDTNGGVGFVRALARSVLLVFVVPALFTDVDGRGMHDRATGTAVVRR